jgi:hypothetical protein
MDSLHQNDDLEAVPPFHEESGCIAIEEPPRPSFFSGRKKAVATVCSIVLMAAIATGVALLARPNQQTALEQSSVAATDNGGPQDQQVIDDEDFDIIDDQGFGADYSEEIIHDESQEQREPEMDLGDAGDGISIAPEKVPVDAEEIEIAEFDGPLTDFIVTSVSRIDVPTDNKCTDPSEGLWTMELSTDSYPWETGYTVKDEKGEVVLAGPPEGRNYAKSTKYLGSLCMPPGQYLLEVTDKAGDGMCCEYGTGAMVVKVNGKTVAETDDSDFSSFKRYITVEEAGTGTSNPTKNPTPASTTDTISKSQLYSVDIKVKTDNYGKETGYKFERINGGVKVNKATGSLTNNFLYQDNFLVDPGQYRLTLTDKFNGLEDGGYFSVLVDGAEVVFGDKWNTQLSKTKSYTIRPGYKPAITDRDRQWLTAHNSRRKTFHEKKGKTYRPLVWSSELAEAASDWVDQLIPTCKISRQPGVIEGENMSTRRSSITRDEGPEVLLSRWVDKHLKSGQGYPENQSMTQVLWRATRYVGCKDKMTTASDGSLCYVSICRYARAGNCAVSQYDSWEVATLADRTKCGPPCPDDVCY